MTETQIATGLIEATKGKAITFDLPVLVYLIIGAIAVWLGIQEHRRRRAGDGKVCAAVLQPILAELQAERRESQREADRRGADTERQIALMAKSQEEQTRLLGQILEALLRNGRGH